MPRDGKRINPAMRFEARLVILDKTGSPIRQMEAFALDFMSVRAAMYAYQFVRSYFRRLKRRGRHLLVETNEIDRLYAETPFDIRTSMIRQPDPAGQTAQPGVD